jgi:hypothetical protein
MKNILFIVVSGLMFATFSSEGIAQTVRVTLDDEVIEFLLPDNIDPSNLAEVDEEALYANLDSDLQARLIAEKNKTTEIVESTKPDYSVLLGFIILSVISLIYHRAMVS